MRVRRITFHYFCLQSRRRGLDSLRAHFYKMVYYVYLLECKNKDEKITYYCGYTSKSPSKRLQAHINNVKREDKKHYTGRQKFVRLVYSESYDDKRVALNREKEIKRLGSRYKGRLIDGVNNLTSKK